MLREIFNVAQLIKVVLACTAAILIAGCAGGTGVGLNLVPAAQVEAMGLETWQKIRAQTRETNNQALQQTAQDVGRKVLGGAGENPDAWEIVVFEGEEVNAFALPGRKIGVYEGMFRVADTADQLAAIIGHEIGHVQQQHAAERVNTQVSAQAGTALIAGVLGAADLARPEIVAQVVGAGLTYGVVLPYSRNQELEADKVGVMHMLRAGYNPRAAIELWRAMGALGDRPPEVLSTHPDPQRRMAVIEEMVNALETRQ